MDAPTPEKTPAAGNDAPTSPAPDWSRLDTELKLGAQRIQALEDELSAERNAVRRLIYVRSLTPGRYVRLEPLDASLGKLMGAHVRVLAVHPDPTHGVMLEAQDLNEPDAPSALLPPTAVQLG